VEAGDVTEHAAVDLGALPEEGEVGALQDVGQVDDGLDILVLHLLGQQQALGHHEVRVRQAGQRLQQDGVGDVEVQHVRVELVQLEHGQVGLQVVGIVLRLILHIGLQSLQMIRVVAEGKARLCLCTLIDTKDVVQILPFDAAQHLLDRLALSVFHFHEVRHFLRLNCVKFAS